MLAKAPFSGVSSFSDIQIQKKVSHLLITSLGSIIGAEKISVSITINGSQAIILPSIKIRDAALKSQFGNGYLYTSKNSDTTFTCEWIIELTGDGSALDLTDNNYLSVNLEGLNGGNTYAVYGIEAPNAKRAFLQTSAQVVSGSEAQSKQFRLNGAQQALYIRNNGGLTQVRIWFATGEECTYTPAELRSVTREMNQITESADYVLEGDAINQTVLNGAQEMFFFPLDGVIAYEVFAVGGTDVVIFTEERKNF